MKHTPRRPCLSAQVFSLCLGLSLVLIPAAARVLSAAEQPPGGKAEVWPEITQDERDLKRVEQDPDADAVVLLKERNGRILKRADDVVNVIDVHVRSKVLNERGKRYGDVQIKAGKYSRVSNIRARTIKADGTVVSLAPDPIFEKVTLPASILQNPT